jgi:hypothetical protein
MLRNTTALLSAVLIAGLAAPLAQAASPSHRVTIEYQDLSGTQDLSSAPFVSHSSAFHLFEIGKPATLLIQQLAELGNPEFILGTAVGDGGHVFRDEAMGLPNLPGKGRKIELSVDAEHPLVSGGWMLGHTNDGFAGIDSVNAYELKKPLVLEVYPLDAGTKKNSETMAETAALGGLGRTPENGVIARHTGIRGDADIPASFKFDPSRPIGRVTISPAK